jgi:hypothetical protein
MVRPAVKPEAWTKFLNEALVDNRDTNLRYSFKKTCKKYGLAYITYLKAAWEANEDDDNIDQFLLVNGNVPPSFFNRQVSK